MPSPAPGSERFQVIFTTAIVKNQTCAGRENQNRRIDAFLSLFDEAIVLIHIAPYPGINGVVFECVIYFRLVRSNPQYLLFGKKFLFVVELDKSLEDIVDS
jgi:hypothetical protein